MEGWDALQAQGAGNAGAGKMVAYGQNRWAICERGPGMARHVRETGDSAAFRA